MAILDPYGDRFGRLLVAVAVLAVLAGVATAGAYAADPSTATPAPVAYDDAVELGLSSETDELMAGSARIPRAQVFYSQLQYVVGYNGVESFAASLDDGRTERQFGYPLVVYVETFDGGNPGVTDDGLFEAERSTDWVPADEATYVAESAAHSPAGETVVPFAERTNAELFAAEHGGRLLDWEAVRDRSFDVDSAATARSMAPARWAAADRRIADAEASAGDRHRGNRSTSAGGDALIVVGEDAPTIDAAAAAAPPNATVVVPAGTYEETVDVNESVVIAGDGARIRGDGNGSVITVRAPNVTLSGLSIDGVGNRTRDPEAAEEDGTWDTNIQLGYGHGDAGIRAIDAPGLLVDDVAIETNASGVLLREGSDAVLRDLRVDGSDDWRDGFMGVTGMESRVTVVDSRFEGGRDGVYLHRADGSVIRNSTFVGNRYGTHLMYTGDALIADNAFRNAEFGGITVMTRPSGNAIVGNDVRGSGAGIQASGTRSYVGYNTLADNGLGFSTSARGSLYERNVAVDNEVGAHATTVVPSSRVVANDFVGNEVHAEAGPGALRVWAVGDRGNHWEGASVGLHEPGERAYRPTSPVDAALHREIAAAALRESPAVVLLDRLRGTVPGARSGSVVDPSPAPKPHAPERIAAATDPDSEPVHPDWRRELDHTMNAHDRNATDGTRSRLSNVRTRGLVDVGGRR
ncbi:Nitrous oxidase accessory protein NosD, contains tandem CASH domains [Halorubrum aquaticum]|uniref:Nitrous oxidase accessory protein NosD, contains tandem CASH domains n=1 Tax=Halorubrum aquaticum TaxID=387340 RepID=A0A1I2Z4S0_9EURY|nr:right-handed parallel beta-helix repeat-containing protein [Halorubrum aquaticum]SFH32001.1 Nitrous oxidase accessory protein NosD, contains tandem CASH domains [Halorubrum aquaticum]